MTALAQNLKNRITRLPKPSSTSEAMQPIFEAVSNAIHATQDRFGNDVSKNGRVSVEIFLPSNLTSKTLIASVQDNGIGLDAERYRAFATADTDFKFARGGKGVGRLLWLDAFHRSTVDSKYARAPGKNYHRRFDFVLQDDDQILNEEDEALKGGSSDLGTTICFYGFRTDDYASRYPKQQQAALRHFVSHFLSTFLSGSCPSVTVLLGEERYIFPDEVESFIIRRQAVTLDTEEYGQLELKLMECKPAASTDLPGNHFVHLIAHDRTVASRKVDGLVGPKFLNDSERSVFHACVSGAYLDERVNQERTSFNFSEDVVEEIAKACCNQAKAEFISAALEEHNALRRKTMEELVLQHPTFAFADVDQLLQHVPIGETKAEGFYRSLSTFVYRKEEENRKRIRKVIEALKSAEEISKDLESEVAEVAESIKDEERRSLTQYVVRRRVVLDFLDALIKKTRVDTRDSSYQLESSLHNFIVPVRLKSDGINFVESDHDLWLIDERLTFAKYFASDVPFDKLLEEVKSQDRPDLLVFDRVFGLRQRENPSRVLVVEFKRPGRTTYADHENPQMQIQRYIAQMRSGEALDIGGRRVNLSNDTLFYCYLVADRLGKMAEWTDTWADTYGGRGKIYTFSGSYRGSIELIEWDALLDDALERNKAFFSRAGLNGGWDD
jgi:hypothetical protein